MGTVGYWGIVSATQSAAASSSLAGESYTTVIVGAGFAGIGAAAQLHERGVNDFVILERADDVGGVWRDNTYPGCQCDVPSSLYSFSFLPKPDWSDRFATQPEIQDYLRGAVRALGIESKVHFGCDVSAMVWNPADQRWTLTLAGGESLTARMVIVGSGALNEPSVPKFEGLADFGGQAFHSAQWPEDFEPSGKKIAVVGTGASALQLVPQIAENAAEVLVFQRTAPWVLPRGDRSVPVWQQQLNGRIPAAMSVSRGFGFIRRELMMNSFARSGRMLSLLERSGRRHIDQQVADPALRAKVTPTFRAGCKRVLMSDTWYPTLARPNVQLVTAPIERFTATGIVTADAADERQVDVVVLATGFRVQRRSILARIIGAQGEPMAVAMAKTAPTAYLGSTLPGFPNLVLMTGPNTGLANNSMILMIESQARYAADMAKYLQSHTDVALDVRQQVMTTFTRELEERLGKSVWADGGCSSWYRDSAGRVTALWPGTTTEFRRRTRQLRLADYEVLERVL